MSSHEQQTIAIADVAALARRGGGFNEDTRLKTTDDPTFVPWGRMNFRNYAPTQSSEPVSDEEADLPDLDPEEIAREHSTPQTAEIQAHSPPPPPTKPTEPSPAPEEIIAAIDTAREDGRAIGYKQGYEAAHREVADALHVLRKLGSELTALADGAVEHNTEIIARHVRRIAQDLFGSVIADMPTAFVDRIKSAATSFTKAGTDFTLVLSPHDRQTLAVALTEEELFTNIKITEDEDLAAGAFRLLSRDLEYEDQPILSDSREQT